jgi:hypothetical protein
MKPHPWQACLAIGFFLALTVVAPAEDEVTFDALTVGTNTFKNVRVIQASPVDLLIGHDDGYRRIPLQALPDSLKTKYPYDPQKAEAYKKQKAEEARLRQVQNAAAVHTSLLAGEAQLQDKIETLQKELKRINADLSSLNQLKQGHGAGPDDRRKANDLRRKKMDVRDQIWKLRDDLEKMQAQRKKYE